MSAQGLVLSSLVIWLGICSGFAGGTSCYTSSFTQSNGTLTSPNYPYDYSNYQNCRWTIVIPGALKINLVLEQISLETCCDHLRIMSGQTNTEYTTPQTIKVTGNTVTVTFTSDSSVTNRGFSIRWNAFFSYNCTVGGDECGVNAHCSNFGASNICACNSGYDGDGLTCSPKDCGVPAIEGHNCTSNSTTFLSTATCTCADGFENDNSSFTIDCLSSGNWSAATDNGNYTQCTRVSCGPPPTLPNSYQTSYSNFRNRYQDTVVYRCLQGYQGSYGLWIACQANGTWMIPGSCTKVTCGAIPRVDNSNPNATVQTGSEYQDTVTYTCLSGYEVRNGRYSVECQASGYWSPAPTCSSGITCGSGHFTQSNGTITSPGYPNSYANGLNCGWTIAPPLARNIELTVERISTELCCDHLYVSSPNTSRLELSTPTTISLTGSPITLTFTSDGSVTGRGWSIRWEAELPQNCTLDGDECNENAHCVNMSDSQICVCNEGYEGNGRTCQGKDCGPLPSIEEVSCTSNSTHYPSSATCNCAPGYDEVLSLPFTIYCESTGSWSHGTGNLSIECSKVNCGAPPMVNNSNVVSTYVSGEEYLDTVNYICPSGYVLNGTSSQATCQANGTWSDPPSCTGVVCGAPPVVYNSDPQLTVQTGNRYQDRVIYTCLPGYEVSSGQYASYCGASGSWLSTPRCSYGTRCQSGFYTNSTGTITSPNYPGSYSNSLNCGWIISPPSAAGIIITVERISVETCCDHLRYSSSNGQSGEFTSPVTREFQGSEVRLTFTSDSSVTYTGWLIRWTALFSCTVNQSECGTNAQCTNSTGSYVCRCNTGYEGDGQTCLGKDCGMPNLSGANCTGNLTRYPNSLPCGCHPGYERVNLQFNLVCGTAGSWRLPSDNVSGNCERIDCGTPPVVQYSDAQRTYGTGTRFQDRVTFSCQTGYVLSTEPNYSRCLANGTWSSPPVCTKVNCGPPPNVGNSDDQATVQTGTRYEDRVTYTCLPGYEMHSESNFIECLADGRWMTAPTCFNKNCGSVPPAEGINCTSPSTRYPSNATCSCNTGYERANPQYAINCQASGTWSSPLDDHPPSCEKVDCGTPPAVPNSNPQDTLQTGTRYLESVTYSCLQGYEEPSNSTSIVCQATGSWSAAPSCTKVNCGTPPTVEHTDTQATVQSGTRYEDTVVYTCRPGYEVKTGSQSIECLATKQWSDAPVCAEIECGSPPLVQNGALTRPQYNTTYDSEVVYKCDGHQYNMVGSATVRCTEDGTWSEHPICHDVNCGPPPAVTNSDRQVSGHSYNDTVTYQCDVGYALEGNSTIVCQVIGYWTVPPVCEELLCGDLPVVENSKGSPVITGTKVGAEATYSCMSGYEMSGEPVIKCQVNQHWTESPQCNRVRCGDPPEVKNADKTVYGHYLNDSSKYECHIGYVRIGDEYIYCQADGHWTVTPVCHVLICGVPPTPKNTGLVSITGTQFGQTATYQCLPGYTTDDPLYITCLLNGTWSRAPNCTEGSSKGSDKPASPEDPASFSHQQDSNSPSQTHTLSSSSMALIICMSLIPTIAIVAVATFCYLAKQRKKRDANLAAISNATYEPADFGETDAVL